MGLLLALLVLRLLSCSRVERSTLSCFLRKLFLFLVSDFAESTIWRKHIAKHISVAETPHSQPHISGKRLQCWDTIISHFKTKYKFKLRKEAKLRWTSIIHSKTKATFSCVCIFFVYLLLLDDTQDWLQKMKWEPMSLLSSVTSFSHLLTCIIETNVAKQNLLSLWFHLFFSFK